jgi:hypothetical protein
MFISVSSFTGKMLDRKWAIGGSVVVVLVTFFSWLWELDHITSRHPSLLMEPITLSIVKKEYVNLCVGEPCRWLKFKLDRSSDIIRIHPNARSSESPTYWSSANSNSASDFFYFDTLRIRLPLVEAPATLMGFADEWVPDGTLGLGPKSPIWVYWQNYTISSTRLYLGQYQYWAQEDPRQRPPIFYFDESTTVVLGDGTEAQMVFDFSTENSLVPIQCDQLTAFQQLELRSGNCQSRYRALGIEAENCIDTMTIYPSQFQEILLESKVEYMAIDYSDDGKVHLGARLFWEIATHFNFKQQCVILASDVYSLNYTGFGMVASLCVMLALFLWPILTTSREALESEFQFLLILLLEYFCYAVNIVSICLSFTSLNWCRYITQFAELSDAYAMIFIIGTLAASVMFSVIETMHYRVPYFSMIDCPTAHKETVKRFRATYTVRVAVFASSQVAALWLFLVEEHEPMLDQGVLMYLLSMLIFLQTCLIFSCYVHDRWVQGSIVAVLSLATIVFTLFYALFPFLRYSHIHYNRWIVGAAWLILLVWAPAIVCSVLYEIDGHKRRKASKV